MDNRFARFAAELLVEVEADRDVLAELTERAGSTAGGIKEWGAVRAENRHEKWENDARSV